MKKISLLYSWFIWFITFFLPESKFTMRFRGYLYSFVMPQCVYNFQVSASAKLFGINKLHVGNNVFIAANTVINTGGKIYLEDDVMIGIGSVVIAGNHTIKKNSFRFGKRDEKDIHIDYDSWIAANCTITSGSNFPPSSVLATNSVFLSNNNTPESGIYGGVPAKLLKKYILKDIGGNND